MDIVEHFHFLRPQWLLLLLPSLLLGVLLWRRRGRESNWSRVVAPELLAALISGDSIRRSRGGIPTLIGAWCLGAVAAAGPSWQQLPQPVLQKQDALVLVMDLSYSMLATDLAPSRQDRVRRKLLDLLRERREGLSALIAYAGDAHIVAPLTDDQPTIANLLPALNPGMMPLPGSNPVEAIERALALLDSAGVRRGRILLVTDGITASDGEAIARRLLDEPRQLLVLGVGTSIGAPIALPGGGFLRSESGEVIVPKLDERALRQLARRSGGRYRALSVDDSDLQALLADWRFTDEADTISRDRRADRWQDMAHWLVLPLLLIALGSFRRGWIYLLPLWLTILPAERARALDWDDLWWRKDQQGRRALEAGDAERATALFADPRWRGAAAYTAQDYTSAREAFARDESADGWYNRGNALAASGDYEQAISAYEKSLQLKPDQDDARHNIETLKRAQQQQEQQNQQQQQQQQQQNPQQQQSQQGDAGQGSDDKTPQSDGGSAQREARDSSQERDAPPENRNQQQQQGAPQERNAAPDREPPRSPPSPDAEREPGAGQAGQAGQGEDETAPAQQPAPQAEIDNRAMQDDLERDQAVQQWLRRVPDDPSGLLREKFRYESRRRQQQGESRDPEQPIW